MNWLTLLVLILLAGMVYKGYRQGLVKIVLGFSALIITIVVTQFAYPVVSGWISDHDALMNRMKQGVESFLEERLKGENAGELDWTDQEETEKESGIFDKLQLPKQITEYLKKQNTKESYLAVGAENLHQYLTETISKIGMKLIAYVITFLIAAILVRVAITVLCTVAKLPLLNGVNRIAGAVLSGVEFIIILWVGILLVIAFSSSSWGSVLMGQIQSSPVLLWLYQHNLLAQLIVGLLPGLV